jgi:DNA-binding CsgD family transcriptional regulator
MHFRSVEQDCLAIDPSLTLDLMDAVGSEHLANSLLNAAQRVDEVGEVFAYRAERGRVPLEILSAGRSSPRERVQMYRSRFWPADPFLSHASEQEPNRGFCAVTRPQDILDPTYRTICFQRPGFVDKLSFGWSDSAGVTVLSFYRTGSAPSEHPIALAAIANVALAAIHAHEQQAGRSRQPVITRIERRLATAYPKLSHREVQICARTLCGSSSKEIGRALGISPASVMTYRQRAYSRYGASSAGDFLDLIIDPSGH